jgi:hypothetical protein
VFQPITIQQLIMVPIIPDTAATPTGTTDVQMWRHGLVTVSFFFRDGVIWILDLE